MSRSYSLVDILSKVKNIRKYRKYVSQTSLSEILMVKQEKIMENFTIFIRRLMAKQVQKVYKIEAQSQVRYNRKIKQKKKLIKKESRHIRNKKENKCNNKQNNQPIQPQKFKNTSQDEYLISFINILNSFELLEGITMNNIMYNGITSIQNLMSQHIINISNNHYNDEGKGKDYGNRNIMDMSNIKEIINDNNDQLQSKLSLKLPIQSYTLTQPLLSQILLAQPQLHVYYVCLYEKLSRQMNLSQLSIKQNQNIIKAIWNILVKYWRDKDYVLFVDIDQQIQWRILEMLGFGFKLGKREVFEAEGRLMRQGQDQIRIRKQSIELGMEVGEDQDQRQRGYFCTLQYIK